MVAGWHWQNLIQMLVLHPQLIFAGDIAGILAAFEHRNDHDFYLNWFGLRLLCGCVIRRQQKPRAHSEQPCPAKHHSSLHDLDAPAMLSFRVHPVIANGRHLVYERIRRGTGKLAGLLSERIVLMEKRMRQFKSFRVTVIAIPVAAVLAFGFSLKAPADTKPAAGLTPLEERAELNLQTARTNPLQLRNFLLQMPKGADLHNHLSGAVYAESWIRAAAADRLCVEPAAVLGTKAVFSPGDGQQPPSCGVGRIPASDVFKNQNPYDDLIDACSMV